jgi:hypothetical protein
MPLNLTKTYTVKSNAQADVRKAVVRGECTIGEFTVVALSGGFRIVPVQPAATPSIEDVATSPAGWREPEIVAENAEAMTEALAASRDDHVPPGLARLRADDRAETICEAVIADQAAGLAQMREELISDPKVTIGAAVADYRAEHPAPVRRGRKAKLDAPKVATAPRPVASPDALKVLTALFHSPALRELADGARVGVWVDYKTINESDRPHGFAGRQVSGLIAGLQRRGLVECRMEKPGKFSTRMTLAGLGAMQEGAR